MVHLKVWTVLLFLIAVNGMSLNVTRQLMKDLMKDYDKNIRPVSKQDMKMNVSVVAYIKSIQEFNEVLEVFSYTGAFELVWIDAGMVWNPADYDGISYVLVSYRKVWTPDLILTTPSDEMDTLGKPWQHIRYYSNGAASWTPAGLLKSTCSINVGKYPFDKQVCKSDFGVWDYVVKELELFSTLSTVDTSLYSGNVAWELDSTNVITSVEGLWSLISVEIHIRRKAGFVVVNILMPILFLSLINVLVFLLIPESGERASFCITVLLSIAVFMTIVSQTLPRSSDPMPVISYKIMLDMVISSLITLVTILNLRLYHKDNKKPIPKWLISAYFLLCCPKQNKVIPMHTKSHTKQTDDVIVFGKAEDRDLMNADSKSSTISIAKRRTSLKAMPDAAVLTTKMASLEAKLNSIDARLERLTSTSDDETITVTWMDISKLIDFVALVTFTAVSVLSFAVFLMYVSLD